MGRMALFGYGSLRLKRLRYAGRENFVLAVVEQLRIEGVRAAAGFGVTGLLPSVSNAFIGEEVEGFGGNVPKVRTEFVLQ